MLATPPRRALWEEGNHLVSKIISAAQAADPSFDSCKDMRQVANTKASLGCCWMISRRGCAAS